ncbi:MAG: 5'-nucleotidase C-terminal domain-containing protein [Thiolinea sp.]
MSHVDRRTFIKLLSMGALGTTAASSLPWLLQQAEANSQPADYYQLPMQGDARLLHITDVHGQLLPVYFREPNVNLGVGDAYGRPPHIVGKGLLKAMGLPEDEDSLEAYAYTYLNFEANAKKYGRMGGFAHIKTLLNQLREQAGGQKNTLTVDGGDLWQGSGTSLWTRGVDMVEASNILGVDVMVGHWEFTYPEEELLSNVALFKGDFIGQNVRVKEDALFEDSYTEMVEKYDGNGLFDEDSGHAFQPYVIREVAGKRIAVIGQAFPRTANANPPEFFPDWSFGLREDDMRDLVKKIRTEDQPDAVVLVSHNGMDVDIKMAEQVPGMDAVFGGHTHDGIPQPVKVTDTEGGTCLVTNAGSNGKYVGVMDFAFAEGKVKDMHYKMLPVFENMLPADKEMEAYLTQMRSKKYDETIVESRAKDRFFLPERVGKTYDEILSEKLAIADRTLFRRGNFMGTWDQVLCNALRAEYNADIALSAGVRWGTTTPEGEWITMEDVMNQCSMTYGETYANEMTGEAIVNVLEQIADNLFDPDPYLQSGGDMVRVGGLDYTIDPGKKLYERVSDVKLDNGDAIDPAKTYKVAGWAVVNRTPEGRLMWDVARDYILKNKGEDNILKLEKVNNPKLVGVADNPGIADYQGELG